MNEIVWIILFSRHHLLISIHCCGWEFLFNHHSTKLPIIIRREAVMEQMCSSSSSSWFVVGLVRLRFTWSNWMSIQLWVQTAQISWTGPKCLFVVCSYDDENDNAFYDARSSLLNQLKVIKILIRDFRLQLLNLKKHLLYWLCVFRMNSCMYYVVW